MRAAATSVRRRSPTEGGYVRGEETRRRIVEAALQVFAEDGFSGASTRRIAAAAGVTPPALQYYFHGKEGLHRACADLIIAHMLERLNPALATGRAAAASADADHPLAALCDLVDVVADLTIASGGGAVWKRFVSRDREDDTGSAYPRIRAAVGQPIQAMARTLVARAISGRTEDETVRLRTLLILGQLATFHHNREQALQAAGWAELDDDRLAAVKRVVREHTRAVILAARSAG